MKSIFLSVSYSLRFLGYKAYNYLKSIWTIIKIEITINLTLCMGYYNAMNSWTNVFDFQDHLWHSCTIHVLTSILMRYFHITAFFWMFVEGKMFECTNIYQGKYQYKFVHFNICLSYNIFSIGLFLFLQVIAPLHVTMVKLRHYIIIGWGKYFIGMIFMSICIEE